MSKARNFVLLFFTALLLILTIFRIPSDQSDHHQDASLLEKVNHVDDLLHQVVATAFSHKLIVMPYEETVDLTDDFNTADQISSSTLVKQQQPVNVSDGDEKDGVVVKLTGKNFSSFIAEKKYAMVVFYAPWCYWSKKLDPEYEAAAALLKGDDRVALAKVDATMETELARKYDIAGYPTLLFFFAGGVYIPAYDCGRTRDGILRWIRRNTGVHNVTEKDDAQRILAKERLKVVGFFDTLEGQETLELVAASELYPDVSFFQTAGPEVAKMFLIDPQIKRPALIMLKEGAKDFIHFDGPFNRSAIAEFVSISKPPLVTTFNEKIAPWIFQSSRKQLWLLETKSEPKKVKSSFEEASKTVGLQLEFVYAEIGDDDSGRRLVSKFELDTAAPRLIATNRYGERYLFHGVITSNSIKSFGEDFLDDKLPNPLERIPEQILRLHSPFYVPDPTFNPKVAYI